MTAPGPFGIAGPRWFTIPAHRPFVEDLARGLTLALQPLGPEALSDAVVLTPTRRGARALAEAFLAVSGGQAVLLPQVRALGDLDEGEPPFEPGDLALGLPPAISAYRRRFELARLAAEHGGALDRDLDAAAALELADALAGFLDSLQIEEAEDPLGRIDGLVAGELAGHWRLSADFLKLALRDWPRRLAGLGLTDVSERRVALLHLLGRQWAEHPPRTPLIAAGSTGTAPATADLLAVVARAPPGRRGPSGAGPRPRRRRLGPGGRAASAGGDEAAADPRRRRPRRGAPLARRARGRRGARPLAAAPGQRGPAPGRGDRRLARPDRQHPP